MNKIIGSMLFLVICHTTSAQNLRTIIHRDQLGSSLTDTVSIKNTLVVASEFAPNEIIVCFKDSALNLASIKIGTDAMSTVSIANLIRNQQLKGSLDSLTIVSGHKLIGSADPKIRHSISRTGETIAIPSFHNMFVLSVPSGTDILSLCRKLNKLKFIEFAEPNFRLEKTSTTPNDTMFPNQIHLDGNLHDNDIDVTVAWAVSTGSSNIKVGVVDTGIDYTNPDLGSTFGSGAPKVTGGHDYTNNDNDPRDDDFNYAHGTASAGIIGALSNNGIGVAGIAGGDVAAGNNGVQLIALKAAVYVSEMIAAIYDGATSTSSGGYGCNVINVSLVIPTPNPDPLGQLNALRHAISYAAQNGVITVAAKGNTDNNTTSNPLYPADFDDNLVMSIGGAHDDDSRAGSSYGANMDVVAYDNNVLTTGIGGSGYRNGSGTSAAAPQVSGIAALLRSVNANLHRDDVENIIEISADRVRPDLFSYTNGYNLEMGNGRVNAGRALKFASYPWVVQQLTSTGGTSQQITQGSGEGIILNNDAGGLATDWYFGQMFQVTKTITLPTYQCGSNYVWSRTANATLGWSGANPNNQMGYNFVVSRTSTTVTLRTFVYYIKYNSIGQTFNAWYPCAPADVIFAYSTLGIPGPALNITGPDLVCSTGQYSATASTGSTVSFTSNTPSVLQVGASTGAASRVNSFSGNVMVTATYNGGSCAGLALSKSTYVGVPTFTNPTVDGSQFYVGSCFGVCPGSHIAKLTPVGPTPSSWSWTASPVGAAPWSWSLPNLQITFSSLPHNQVYPFSFIGTASNTCGASQPFTFCFIKGPGCPQSLVYSVSPNPAGSELVVTNSDSADGQPVEIALYNSSMIQVVSLRTSEPIVRISTLHVLDGEYILQVTGKGGTLHEHIVIKK